MFRLVVKICWVRAWSQHTHTRMHACMHTRTHTHTHTHTAQWILSPLMFVALHQQIKGSGCLSANLHVLLTLLRLLIAHASDHLWIILCKGICRAHKHTHTHTLSLSLCLLLLTHSGSGVPGHRVRFSSYSGVLYSEDDFYQLSPK